MPVSVAPLALTWLVSACVLASAAPGSDAMAMKTYVYLKQDSSLYVGEGEADLKDFDSSYAKAIVAAKERARLDLASTIKVQITGQTTEKLEFQSGKVAEQVHSQSESKADLVLENLKYMDFKDLPEAGQVTVLASISKEDYRRQRAGKGARVYLPEFGLSIGGGVSITNHNDMMQQYNAYTTPALDDYELDFIWEGFYGGFQGGYCEENLNPSPTNSGGPSKYTATQNAYTLKLGYDWTPWPWRVQPFVPLQGEYTYWDMDPSFAQTFDVSTGLGVRFWPNDSVAFQIQGQWHQSLWGGGVYQSGGNLYTINGKDAVVTMTGPELSAAIVWSGF
jgi:hypothetical protein